MGFERNYKKIS